jgi:DNA-binding NarL/FixJ family response regulator
MAPEELRVVLVDDQDLLLEGLRAVLDRQPGMQVVGSATDVEGALQTVRGAGPDAVVLDLQLGGQSGAEVARRLRAEGSAASILMLSADCGPADLRDALRSGADGYLLKTATGGELVEALLRVCAGETVITDAVVPGLVEQLRDPLGPVEVTPREREVLDLVARGLGNRDIAGQLAVSMRTAQKHVENLFRKLRVHDREGLVTEARRRGILR